jgi:hypothetical protein
MIISKHLRKKWVKSLDYRSKYSNESYSKSNTKVKAMPDSIAFVLWMDGLIDGFNHWASTLHEIEFEFVFFCCDIELIV